MVTYEELSQLRIKTLEEINALLRQLKPDARPVTDAALLKIIHDENVVLLTAKEGGKVVGMGVIVIMHTLIGIRGYIDEVVVDEGQRGKGIGQEIMKRLIEIAKEKRVSRIELTSRPAREAANKLYQKLGFEKRETNVYRLKLS